MKLIWSHLDKFRQQDGSEFSTRKGDTFGAFQVPFNGSVLRIIATDGEGIPKLEKWEHVSVHAYDPVFKKQRIPKWEEMCFVKSLFWNDDEVVMQLHVASKDHINIHDCVLHLWRPKETQIPLPPKYCV